jgi:hypothetical protein
MKNHLLLFSVILYIFVLTPLLRADDFVGENLILSEDADIAGNLSLGTNGSDPGLTFHHNGTTATITMTSSQEAAKWEWWRTPSGGAVISMKLDASNQLILYNAAGTTAGITLNPAGTSAFVNGITIGGSAVLTSAAAASTYLTPSTANSTYIRKDVTSLAIGSGTTADSMGGFAFGNGTTASGWGSVALGGGNTTTGNSSVAIGGGNTVNGGAALGWLLTVGNHATALGYSNVASGGYSTVTGTANLASGLISTAMGASTEASGQLSLAAGYVTKAQGYAQVVIGQYNIAQGNSTNWVTTDDLFTLGNGTADNARSNAFVVKKNGDTTVNGGLQVVTDAVAGYGVTIGTGTNSDGGNLRLLSSTNHWNMDNYAGSLRFFTETNYGSGGSVKATLGATGNLTVNGTDNRLPNQTLADDTSILTRSLADVRYLTPSAANTNYIRKDVTSLAVGPSATATGTNSFSFGAGASASGPVSVAMGSGASVSSTGGGSIALGTSASASSTFSAAIGYSAIANGQGAHAFGYMASATNNAAMALGVGSVAGAAGSTAIGPGAIAVGGSATALGYSAYSSGTYAVALGDTTATGGAAISMGVGSLASGSASTAMGVFSVASGYNSTAMGDNTKAQGYAQTVIGRYNVAQGSTNTWVDTDELFTIGNGTSDTSRTNAFVVKKNGEVTAIGKITAPAANFSGPVRVAPQGDISMGEFTAEP